MPQPPLKTPSSVLAYVGFDRIGDGLLKLPFVRGLRAAFPDARITWLAGRETSVYADLMSGAVEGLLDEIIENGGVGLSPWELLGGHSKGPLAGRRFDLIIDTQRIFWVSLSLKRLPHGVFISPAGRFWLSSRKPGPGYRFPKTMQRQLLDLLELASGAEFPTPDRLALDLTPDVKDAAQGILPKGPSYVGFAPGSGGPPKCWPLENFIQLARRQQARGRTPVFFLGPKETGWFDEIKAAIPEALFPLQLESVQKAWGYSPLLTIALSGGLDAALSNDSGAGHMFAVGGVPVVILYGVTTPDKFMPMTNKLSILRAQDFGGREMRRIPLHAVEEALEEALV